jgi:hypothetical protein
LARWEQFGKRRNKEEERKNERKGLTLTGLLMEGVEVSPFAASSSRCENMIVFAVPMGYGAARKVTAPTYLDSQ